MTELPAGVTKMPGMLIIWTSWAGQAPPVVGLLEAAIINILPSVILIAQPRKGSHPELGAPWELPWLHSPGRAAAAIVQWVPACSQGAVGEQRMCPSLTSLHRLEGRGANLYPAVSGTGIPTCF